MKFTHIIISMFISFLGLLLAVKITKFAIHTTHLAILFFISFIFHFIPYIGNILSFIVFYYLLPNFSNDDDMQFTLVIAFVIQIIMAFTIIPFIIRKI